MSGSLRSGKKFAAAYERLSATYSTVRFLKIYGNDAQLAKVDREMMSGSGSVDLHRCLNMAFKKRMFQSLG